MEDLDRYPELRLDRQLADAPALVDQLTEMAWLYEP